MLDHHPRNPENIIGFPREDVRVGTEEGGEREFLCRVKVRAYLDCPR